MRAIGAAQAVEPIDPGDRVAQIRWRAQCEQPLCALGRGRSACRPLRQPRMHSYGAIGTYPEVTRTAVCPVASR